MRRKMIGLVAALIVFGGAAGMQPANAATGEGEEDLFCNAGGPGAVWCELTLPLVSCEVRCGTGYYACCSKHLMVIANCVCIPTGGGPQYRNAVSRGGRRRPPRHAAIASRIPGGTACRRSG